MHTRIVKYGVAFTLVFLTAVLAKMLIVDGLQPNLLTLRLTSNSHSVDFQVYYDKGRGINEHDSVSVAVGSTAEPVTVRFFLPAGPINSVRIDPGSRPNEFSVESIAFNSGVYRGSEIEAVVKPLQGISAIAAGPSEVKITTNGNDPQLSFSVSTVKYPPAKVGLTDQGAFLLGALLAVSLLFLTLFNFDRVAVLFARFKLKYVLAIVLSGILFSQLIYQIAAITKNTESVAIIDSSDWDGARGIETSMRSGWFNDNGWIYYGNFYYRLAHSFQKLDPAVSFSLGARSEVEKSFHFSLMVVSLVALYGLMGLLAFIVGRRLEERLLALVLLNICFMTNQGWTGWVFRVHPDILLAALTAYGVYFSFNYLRTKRTLTSIVAAVFWGLALATKLSTLIFLPGCLLLFVSLDWKKGLKDFVFFSLVILGIYFAVGFPQNFRVTESLGFLRNVSDSTATLTFRVVLDSVRALMGQLIPVLVIVVVFPLVFMPKGTAFPVSNVAKIIAIVILPFGYLVFSNMTIRMDHYFLPIAASTLTVGAVISVCIGAAILRRFSAQLQPTILRVSMLVYPIAVFSAPFLGHEALYSISRVLYDAGVGEPRRLANELYGAIEVFQNAGRLVQVDPYVPYNSRLGNVGYSDSPTLKKVDLRKVEVLVLSREYDSRFDADEGTIAWEKSRPDWEDVRFFYRIFPKAGDARDPYGQTWKVTREFGDGHWQIWQKQFK